MIAPIVVFAIICGGLAWAGLHKPSDTRQRDAQGNLFRKNR